MYSNVRSQSKHIFLEKDEWLHRKTDTLELKCTEFKFRARLRDRTFFFFLNMVVLHPKIIIRHFNKSSFAKDK